MKRFILKILLLALIVFLIDRGFGMTMNFLQSHAKGGYIGHHNNILHKCNDDILIFGSSRAIHHYNPEILTDSLGLSCYNCGQDGNGIVMFYGWWQIIKNRYLPKCIIYDVNPSFDFVTGEDNHKFLGWLRSEYDNDSIKKIFEDIDNTEKYKMFSMMYRYNSKFLQCITDYIHPIFSIKGNGFLPLSGEMDKMKIKSHPEESKSIVYDSLKIKYLENLTIDAKRNGVNIIFAASPMWYGIDKNNFTPLINICKKHNVRFLDFSNNSKYVHNNEYFKDGSHLNAKGADEFTKDLIECLKESRDSVSII